MRNSNRDNNSFFATAVKWSIHQPWVLKKADIVKKKKKKEKNWIIITSAFLSLEAFLFL